MHCQHSLSPVMQHSLLRTTHSARHNPNRLEHFQVTECCQRRNVADACNTKQLVHKHETTRCNAKRPHPALSNGPGRVCFCYKGTVGLWDLNLSLDYQNRYPINTVLNCNKTSNVRITRHSVAFVQPMLQWGREREREKKKTNQQQQTNKQTNKF